MVLQCLRLVALEDFFGIGYVIPGAVGNRDKLIISLLLLCFQTVIFPDESETLDVIYESEAQLSLPAALNPGLSLRSICCNALFTQ